jgi:hypothetical protein
MLDETEHGQIGSQTQAKYCASCPGPPISPNSPAPASPKKRDFSVQIYP